MAIPSITALNAGDKFTATRHGEIRTMVAFLLAPPEAVATNTAGTSIPNNAETVVPMATETKDTGPSWDGAMHDNVTNNSRITITTAGSYDIEGLLTYAGNATGRRVMNLRKNANGVGGAGTLLGGTAWPSTPLVSEVCSLYLRIPAVSLALNDVLEQFAFQTSGGGLTLTTTNVVYLRARLVGS